MVVALSTTVSSMDTTRVLLVDTHTGEGERSPPPHRGSELQALTLEGRNFSIFSKDAGEGGWDPRALAQPRVGRRTVPSGVHYRAQPSAVGSRRRGGPGRSGSARGRDRSKG